MAQLSPIQSWNLMEPSDESAVKSGALSPSLNAIGWSSLWCGPRSWCDGVSLSLCRQKTVNASDRYAFGKARGVDSTLLDRIMGIIHGRRTPSTGRRCDEE